MAAIAILAGLLSGGASWYTGQDPFTPQWYNVPTVEWSKTEDAYSETTELTQARTGYTRNFETAEAPSGITGYLYERFQDLTKEELNQKWLDETGVWYRDPLPASTKWADSKAGSEIGQIKIALNDFRHFTVFRLDPPDGYIDQDFQGNAVIHGLNDDKRYHIHAWDGLGYVGNHVVAISDKYIRGLNLLPDSYGGGRNPAMGQKVVADPNSALWMSAYQVEPYGLSYRFVRVYSIDQSGKVNSSFQVPLTTSYVKTWETDILLEDDGDVVFAACETPSGAGYTGPSYIGRIERSGQTVWEADATVRPALGITKRPGGYAYIGVDWNPSGTAYGSTGGVTQYGSLCKIDAVGVGSNWGSTGTTSITLDYTGWDIRYDELAGVTVFNESATELTNTAGGSCSTDFDSADCADAFDENLATTVDEVQADNNYVRWDFGAGNAQAPYRLYIATYSARTGGLGGVSWYVQGSDDAVSWTTVGSRVFAIDPGATDATDNFYYTGAAKRYWQVLLDGATAAGGWPHKLKEFQMYAATQQDSPVYTICGQRGQYSTDLVAKYGGTESGTADGIGGTFGTVSMTNGETVDWTFAANQTVSSVWFAYKGDKDKYGDQVTFTFQYFGGGIWNTLGTQTACGAPPGWTGYWGATLNFAAVTSDKFRFVISCANGACPGADCVTYPSSCGGCGTDYDGYIGDVKLYGSLTQQAVVSQFYAVSGVSEGVNRWLADNWGMSSGEPGYFYSLAYGERNGKFYAAGSTDTDQVNLNLNRGIIGCVTSAGVTQWVKTYPEVSSFYNIAPCADGTFLLAGTLYTGTSVQSRKAAVMKIDREGNVDPKFPQYFNEDTHWADGRGVTQTRDGGAVWVGGSSRSDINASMPYYGKLDRFMRSRTKGKMYN